MISPPPSTPLSDSEMSLKIPCPPRPSTNAQRCSGIKKLEVFSLIVYPDALAKGSLLEINPQCALLDLSASQPLAMGGGGVPWADLQAAVQLSIPPPVIKHLLSTYYVQTLSFVSGTAALPFWCMVLLTGQVGLPTQHPWSWAGTVDTGEEMSTVI